MKMNFYVTYNSYDGVYWVFENKDKITETMGGEEVRVVTQGKFIEEDSIYLDGYATQPIAYIKGENGKYYFVWDDFNSREVRENEMDIITSLSKDEDENAFNAMIDLYIMYKNGEMSESMIEQMNNVAGNWIEHCESELIKLGLEYYGLKKSV